MSPEIEYNFPVSQTKVCFSVKWSGSSKKFWKSSVTILSLMTRLYVAAWLCIRQTHVSGISPGVDMSAISAQSTYIPTSIIKNLLDIPANIKWKIMVPHMAECHLAWIWWKSLPVTSKYGSRGCWWGKGRRALMDVFCSGSQIPHVQAFTRIRIFL